MSSGILYNKKMETIEITKANAINAYKEAPQEFKPTLATLFGKNVLFDKITDRIQSWEDVCDFKGIDPVKSLPYPDPQNPHEEYMNACHVLAIGIEVLNEDWRADYLDDNQVKYEPRFIHKSGAGLSLSDYDGWAANSVVGPRLVYRSSELLYHGVKIFMPWYKKIHSH